MSILSQNRGLEEKLRLDGEIERNRSERLSAHDHYSELEADDIARYPFRLFPKEFVLSLEETDDFRALCAFSQVTMKPPHQISSHRRYVGPFIVKAKRILWPLMHLHLKDTLAGIQEFQVRAVVRQAKELVQRSREHVR